MDWNSIREEMTITEQRAEDAGITMRLCGSMSHRIDDETMYLAGGGLRTGGFVREDIRRVKFRRAMGDAAVHAAIYRVRSDVQTVLITKQCYGSALGVLKMEKLAAEDQEGNTFRIRIVPFTIPGSDAQRSLVSRLTAMDKTAEYLITQNHGVIAFGPGAEEALVAALTLEEYAKLYLSELANTRCPYGVVRGYDSTRDGENIRYTVPDTPARVRLIHEEIYAMRPDVRAVVHNRSEAALTVSRLNERLLPLYDDFVALVGAGIKIPVNENASIGRGEVVVRNNVHAVFDYDDGAYCFGRDENQALFTAMSLEKNCIAQIASARLDGANVISARDIRRLGRKFRIRE